LQLKLKATYLRSFH